MASIKLGAIITEISGKLGGHVFSRDVNGHYLRTKIKPPNPQTAAQSQYRSMFRQIAASWGTLTKQQRESFINLVEAYKKTNVFGDLKSPTAKALFQRLNNNLLITGQSVITNCLPPSQITAPIVESAVLELGMKTFEINLSAACTNSEVIISATPNMSSGTIVAKRELRVIANRLLDVAEPESTNFVLYPISFGNSYWSKGGTTIQGDEAIVGSDLVTNGDFATDPSTYYGAFRGVNSWNSGTLDYTCTSNITSGDNNFGISQGTILSSQKEYIVTFKAKSSNVTTPLVVNFSGASAAQPSVVNILNPSLSAGYQSYSFKGFADSVSFIITIPDQSITSGVTEFTIDNLVIKEVLQGFASPSVVYPTSAFKLVESSANAVHLIFANIGATSGQNHTFSCFVKKTNKRYVTIGVIKNAFDASSVQFDLDTQTVSYSGTVGTLYPITSSKISALDNGYYRISITILVTGTAVFIGAVSFSDNIVTNPNMQASVNAYQGDGTSGGFIYGAQLEQQLLATPLIYNGKEGAAVTRYANTVLNIYNLYVAKFGVAAANNIFIKTIFVNDQGQASPPQILNVVE